MKLLKITLATLTMLGLGLSFNTSAVAASVKKKTAVVKKSSKKTSAKKKIVIKKPAAPAAVTPSVQELQLAKWITAGTFPCEVGSVSVAPDPANTGYFKIAHNGKTYHMSPRVTASGALRLIDPAQGAVWLQLGNKSMLISEKLGRRLATDCMSDAQRALAAQLLAQPAADLLGDTPATAPTPTPTSNPDSTNAVTP